MQTHIFVNIIEQTVSNQRFVSFTKLQIFLQTFYNFRYRNIQCVEYWI